MSTSEGDMEVERTEQEDEKKRKREHDVVLGNQLRSSVAKTLTTSTSVTCEVPSEHDDDSDDSESAASNSANKKRKVAQSDSRPRTRRSSGAFGLPTIPEVPSPPKEAEQPISMKATDQASSKHVCKQIPPPPPPRMTRSASSAPCAAAHASAKKNLPPPPPPRAVENHSKQQQTTTTTTSSAANLRQIPPPPPRRDVPGQSAQQPSKSNVPTQQQQVVHHQPQQVPTHSAKSNDLMDEQDDEEEDNQPFLTTINSTSFDSPLQQEQHEIEDEDKTQTRPTNNKRSWLRTTVMFTCSAMPAFLVLLIAVSLVMKDQNDESGLQLHLVLPPDMEQHNLSMPLDEDRLRQYWKDHAPAQAAELLEHVEAMNSNNIDNVVAGQQQDGVVAGTELSTAAPPTSNGVAPMCVSFFVQSVSDLLAATNIQVSFPDGLLRESSSSKGHASQLLGATAAPSSDPNTAMVPFHNSQLESSLLSRMTAFRFPLLAWMHAGDQHVVVMPPTAGHGKEQQQPQELRNDAQLLSMEIRPCDEDDDGTEEEEGSSGRKRTKSRRRKRKVFKNAARIVEGTTKKIQQEADKLKQGVQDTGKKIQQGIGGIKDKTGSLLMNVASWHKNKKWL